MIRALRLALLAGAALVALPSAVVQAEALQGGQASAAVLAGAPAMGTGAYRDLAQFTSQEAARLAEDDAAARAYGLPLGLDDHASTPATAAPLSGSVVGVVETPRDRDVFVIHSGAGPLAAQVVTAVPEGRAGMVLVLRDAAGAVLAAPGPVLAYALAEAGTYYLDVEAPAGAAAGAHYRLSASYPPAAAP